MTKCLVLVLVVSAVLVHGDNLIQDPSFEASSFTSSYIHSSSFGAWRGDNVLIWGPSYCTACAAAADGGKAVQMEKRSGRLWQDIATTPGSTYSVTFALGSYGNNAPRVFLEVPGEHHTFSAPSSKSWNEFTVVFAATSTTTRILFREDASGPRYAHIDNVRVEIADSTPSAGPAPPTGALQCSALSNGGFESPTVQGGPFIHRSSWDAWTGTNILIWDNSYCATYGCAPTTAGNQAIQLETTGGTMQQNVATSIGATYVLKFALSSYNNLATRVRVKVSTVDTTLYAPDHKAWAEHSVTFIATSSSTQVQFIETGYSPRYPHIDNVRLCVPDYNGSPGEPSSPPSNSNILFDPSFEGSVSTTYYIHSSQWGPWRGDNIIIWGPQYCQGAGCALASDGSQAIQFETRASRLYQDVATTIGTTYLVTFSLSSYANNQARLTVQLPGLSQTFSAPAGRAWTEYTTEFVAQSTTTRILFREDPSGPRYPHLDNIRVISSATSPPTPAGPEVCQFVTNGDFEASDFTSTYIHSSSWAGWTGSNILIWDNSYCVGGACPLTTDGQKAIQLEASGGSMQQIVATTAGAQYTLRFALSSYSGQATRVRVKVGNTDTTHYAPNARAWADIAIPFVAQSASTEIQFIETGYTPRYPHIDAVKLCAPGAPATSPQPPLPTPTPTTLAPITPAPTPWPPVETTTPVPPEVCTGTCLINRCLEVGSTFAVTVTGASTGDVFGTYVYTDDSDVSTAAVHAGLIAPGETKQLTVTCVAAQDSFEGTVQNSVVSQNYGAWPRAFAFDGAPQEALPEIQICRHEPCVLNKCAVQGTSFEVLVTGSTSGSIWGADFYTDDSSLSTAAVHAGVLNGGEEGVVKVSCTGSRESYGTTHANGVTSGSFGPWQFSYSLGSGRSTPPPSVTHDVCTKDCLFNRCPEGNAFRLFVTGTTLGFSWGTSAYSDDSTVGFSAIHAGLVTNGETKIVTATCAGAQSAFQGTAAHGVTTSSYGAWGSSYTLSADTAPGPTAASGLFLHNKCFVKGAVFDVTVTGTGGAQIWGDGVYSDDSEIGTAAVHAGLVEVGATAPLRAICAGGQTSFQGSTAHGVTSNAYAEPWAGSYRLYAA